MKIENKLPSIALLILITVVVFNNFQLFQLQQINNRMQKSTANMAIQLKTFMTPPPAPESIATGTIAPEFTLKDSNNQNISLANLQKEKKKILVFSSSTCPYCEEYYPSLDKYEKEHGDEVEIIVVQAASTPEQNKKFLSDHNYNFKVLVADQKTMADYNVVGTPTTIVLDTSNNVVGSMMSSTYGDLLNLIPDNS